MTDNPLILTIRQPHAAYVLREVGGKDIENRPHHTEVRGRIGIHAAKHLLDGELALGAGPLPRGAVIGTLDLVGCHEAGTVACALEGCYDNPWAEFHTSAVVYHWMLDHPRPYLHPIPASGKRGLWQADDTLARQMDGADNLVLLATARQHSAYALQRSTL